jgi:hypothetical protein
VIYVDYWTTFGFRLRGNFLVLLLQAHLFSLLLCFEYPKRDGGFSWSKHVLRSVKDLIVFPLQSKSEVAADATSQAAGVNTRRKTKIVCTIGPSTNTREMIWKLAETGMNVARMNMSHGDHQSHQKVIDLVKEYNAENTDGNTIAIMLDTKVCHGWIR